MSYGNQTDGLGFGTIRAANLRRIPVFKNARGEISHPLGVDSWIPAQWSNAAAGEMGELCNKIKKYFDREDISQGDYEAWGKAEIADEIADTICYLDLLAARLDIDLSEAFANKFNRVSKRVGSRVYIGGDNEWHLEEEKL